MAIASQCYDIQIAKLKNILNIGKKLLSLNVIFDTLCGTFEQWRVCKLDIIKLLRHHHKWMCSMISALQNVPQICVNYFFVENNYFIVALCYR